MTLEEESQVFMTLGARQTALLTAFANGKTPQVIAWELGISFKTISSHMTALRKRFKVDTQCSIVKLGIRLGLTTAARDAS